MCCCLLFLSVRCLVQLSAVVSRLCNSVLVSLSGRVARCPVVWGSLPRFPAPLYYGLLCCAVVWCPPVMLRCVLTFLLVLVVSFLLEKPPRNPQKCFSFFTFFLFENQTYTQPNTATTSKTMNPLATYMLSAIGGDL